MDNVTDVRGSSVLIVDDLPENRRLLAAVLRRGGLAPRSVTSGRRAIEAAVIDLPDLVLLDVSMPEMSGLDVCRWFKQDERLRRIPIREMKKHCVIGAGTLATVLERHPDNQFLRLGVEVARSHHEAWDGSGYPDNLNGTAIPLAARIVALADFYDALTSNRCYRPAHSHVDTCTMIRESSGTHFDPDVVTAFSILDSQFRHIRHEMQN